MCTLNFLCMGLLFPNMHMVPIPFSVVNLQLFRGIWFLYICYANCHSIVIIALLRVHSGNKQKSIIAGSKSICWDSMQPIVLGRMFRLWAVLDRHAWRCLARFLTNFQWLYTCMDHWCTVRLILVFTLSLSLSLFSLVLWWLWWCRRWCGRPACFLCWPCLTWGCSATVEVHLRLIVVVLFEEVVSFNYNNKYCYTISLGVDEPH